MERTNAMHVNLPERVGVVTIDLGWTRQTRVLPNVADLISPEASVITLIKPHYEAPKESLVHGVLPDEEVDSVVDGVLAQIIAMNWTVEGTIPSPIRGHGGNAEVLALLTR
jgi:23S rRNA (cytidine1920-2'-O)/16S rRNA (cytidine1409-2'-O)-methyltransferase